MMRFGKFNLVGILGAIVQLTLLALLVRHIPVIFAAPIAVEAAVLHNLIWHECFTWRERRPKSFRERFRRALKFHAANGLVSLVGNTVLLYALANTLKMPAVPAGTIAIASCSILNYWLADRWVYA